MAIEMLTPMFKTSNGLVQGTLLRTLTDARLPAEYQECEYISTNGTAIINTGLELYHGYQVKFKGRWTSTPPNDTWFMGDWKQNVGSIPARTWLVGKYNVYRCQAGDDNSSYYGQYPSGTDTNWHEYEIRNEGYWIDEVQRTGLVDFSKMPDWHTETSGHTPRKFITIGRSHHVNSGTMQRQIGEVIFKDHDNTVVRDYVPCYRKSDNTSGFYDIANDEFKPSDYYSSSYNYTPMTHGPDVQHGDTYLQQISVGRITNG